MADNLGIHVSQLKRYEKGAPQPTFEVFRKIVPALSVSADTLLIGDERGPDEDLRFHFETISKLEPEEKTIIKELVEGILLKHDAKRWTRAS